MARKSGFELNFFAIDTVYSTSTISSTSTG
jgi:hypothetical protein